MEERYSSYCQNIDDIQQFEKNDYENETPVGGFRRPAQANCHKLMINAESCAGFWLVVYTNINDIKNMCLWSDFTTK